MNRIFKIAAALTMSALAIPSSAFAQTSFIRLSGSTDSNAIGATVLIADKDAQLTSLSGNQIFYINQFPIGNDGSFSMELPLFSESAYSLYTNASQYNVYTPAEKVTLYVSSSGNDFNSGESESEPLQTLEQALKLAEYAKEIVIMDSMTYTDAPQAYDGDLTIKGASSDVVLTLPSTVNLKGNLTLSNLTTSGISTIYANGYKLKIDETVTTPYNSANKNANRMTVYGGTNGTAYTGDTSIELLGGYYAAVYGGSNNAVVTGSTNVIFGGKANEGDGINDASGAEPPISPCYIYGGGNGSSANVTQATNVTVSGNAVSRFVFGANAGTGNTPPVINVNIAGGKVMNVFGGAKSQSLSGCEIHVTMTGGLVEAIFGGCENAALTGNVYVNLEGGIVSRRVYSGCYNNVTTKYSTILGQQIPTGVTWASDCIVTGTTTLSISPEVTVNATSYIENSDNNSNIGVYTGSRCKSSHSDEINTLIYLDNCSSSYESAMGAQDTKGKFACGNIDTDYTIKTGTGGKVLGTNIGGTIYIAPDNGKYGILNSGATEYVNANAALPQATNTVEFKDYDFSINSLTADTSGTNVSADVNLTANNTSNRENPTALVAIYDENNRFISCSVAENISGTQDYSFDLNCSLEAGKKYTVKAMIWDEYREPLVNVYDITITK